MTEHETPSLENPFLGVPEVAKIFAVKTPTVRQWLRDGKLIGTKLPGGAYRVLTSEVKRFAQEMYGEN